MLAPVNSSAISSEISFSVYISITVFLRAPKCKIFYLFPMQQNEDLCNANGHTG